MMDDQAIRSVVTRLSRQHPSGGQVIERAAILAEGAQSGAILDWITSHDGLPEAQAGGAPARGLHQGKLEAGHGKSSSTPRRYVLPPEALS